MNIPYFFEPHLTTDSVNLNDANTHYMLQVLRMKEKESFFLTNGRGQKWLCTIQSIAKKDVAATIVEKNIVEPRMHPLHLAIAFTKNPSRMEWLLEKVCEMGIESITPILTQRSEKNYFKKERFEKILIAAMLQSQQTYLPILEEPKALKDIIEREYDQKLIAYCGQEFEKFSALNAVKPRKSTLFLIGPEGDFTSDEVHLCMQNQFSAIHLGANRLRTETAGLFVCTLFNAIQ